ncbi:hypothetical protein KBC97_02270 [Candidatus Gracilibacteria bacterium]|nr:hypothetical protein [Candidatus Gracilibacteria bacterium]
MAETQREDSEVAAPKVGKEHHLAVDATVDRALSAQRNLTATEIHQAGAATKIEDWDALNLHHES